MKICIEISFSHFSENFITFTRFPAHIAEEFIIQVIK